MQCGTARSWMQMRRDATLPAAQARELEEHAIGCESCAAYAHEEQLLDGWLLQAPVAEPAANFEWRLKLRLAQLEREGRTPALPARALPWRPWAQFGGAMAAAALVVVLTWALCASTGAPAHARAGQLGPGRVAT